MLAIRLAVFGPVSHHGRGEESVGETSRRMIISPRGGAALVRHSRVVAQGLCSGVHRSKGSGTGWVKFTPVGSSVIRHLCVGLNVDDLCLHHLSLELLDEDDEELAFEVDVAAADDEEDAVDAVDEEDEELAFEVDVADADDDDDDEDDEELLEELGS